MSLWWIWVKGTDRWKFPLKHLAGSGTTGWLFAFSFRANLTIPLSLTRVSVCVCVCAEGWGCGLPLFLKVPLFTCWTSTWYQPVFSSQSMQPGTPRRCQRVFGKQTQMQGPAESEGLSWWAGGAGDGKVGADGTAAAAAAGGVCFQHVTCLPWSITFLMPQVNTADFYECQTTVLRFLSDIHPHCLPRAEHIHFDCSPHKWWDMFI